MADRRNPRTPGSALLFVLGPVLAACNALPHREEAPPPELFPSGWTVLDLTRPLDRDAPYLRHANSFPFERLTFTPDAAPGPGGRDRTPLTTGAFTLLEHQGTHVAAPRSTREDGRTVDAVAPERLVLEVVVLDLPADGTGSLTRPDVEAHERLWGPIPRGAAVILRTGLGRLAASDPQLLGRRPDGSLDFPGFAEDTVKYLTGTRMVAMVGTDALALDAGSALPLRAAEVAAADAGVPVLVALADLSSLPPRGARIVVGVLPVEGAAGAAARVLALLPPPERLPQPIAPPVARSATEGGTGNGPDRAPAEGPR